MLRFKQMLFQKRKIQEELQKIGSNLGSNEGGTYKDDVTNEKYYIKHYQNPDQAKAEVLASKIYDHMGIKTLKPKYKEMNGKPTVITKWQDDLRLKEPEEYDNLKSSEARDLAKMYHAAILTKNWDIVGLEHDNIMQHKDGSLYSVDHGGSFHFRAQGGNKPYGSDISEHGSLRYNNFPSGHVFSNVFEKYPRAEREALQSVKQINPEHVKNLFVNSGLDNWKELYYNFNERRKNLLAHYGSYEEN